MAERFLRDGYRAAANIPGFVSPPKVNGRIPDLLGYEKHYAVITKVDTASSYAAPQTQQAAVWNVSPANWWSISLNSDQ